MTTTNIKHDYDNDVFAMRLIIKNLDHVITSSQASDAEKERCQLLLEKLRNKIDSAQELLSKQVFKSSVADASN